MAWAVLMAGGSIPTLPAMNQEFAKFVSQLEIAMVKSDTYKILEKSGIGAVIYASESDQIIPIIAASGKYTLKFINPKTGAIELIKKSIKISKQFDLKTIKNKEGIYWLQKI